MGGDKPLTVTAEQVALCEVIDLSPGRLELVDEGDQVRLADQDTVARVVCLHSHELLGDLHQALDLEGAVVVRHG